MTASALSSLIPIGLSPIEPAYLFDDSLTSYLKILSEGMIFPRGEEAKKWFSQPHDIEYIIKFSIEAEKKHCSFFTEVLSHNAFFYSRKMLENFMSR
jgi:rubrerythrin